MGRSLPVPAPNTFCQPCLTTCAAFMRAPPWLRGRRGRRLAAEPVEQAHHAARQEQRHDDEQQAERVQPELRQRRGEESLRVVHEHRAGRRAVQHAAASHGHPDHHFDGVDGLELAGIDDAHLRHIERAGDSGEHRREREDPQLVRLDAVADEARAALGVADRLHHAPGARQRDVAAGEIPEDQRDGAGHEQRHARRRAC